MIRAAGPSLSWVVPPHGIVVPIGYVDPILPSGVLWETIGGVMVADPIGLNSSGQATGWSRMALKHAVTQCLDHSIMDDVGHDRNMANKSMPDSLVHHVQHLVLTLQLS